MAHEAPDVKRDMGLVNITHVNSGAAVIRHVPEWALPDVIHALAELDWSTEADVVGGSAEHFAVITEVCDMIDKKASQRQEARIAGDLPGGKVQPASGARWGYRRDVITPEFLIEAKTTSKPAYRVSDADLAFLKEQAYTGGLVPVYAIEIQDNPDVIIIPTGDVDDACFDNTKRKVVLMRTRKSYPVTVEVAEYVNDGGSVSVRLPSGYYTVLGYETFLEIAKKGLE